MNFSIFFLANGFSQIFFIRNRVKFQKKIFVKILRNRDVNLRFSILIVISNFENPRPYENNFFDFFLILLACLAPEQRLSLPARSNFQLY